MARREWKAAEEAAIEELSAALDEDDRQIVAALPLDRRRAAIARLSARAKERPSEHPAGSGAGAASPGGKLLKDMSPAELAEAQKNRRSGFLSRWTG